MESARSQQTFLAQQEREKKERMTVMYKEEIEKRKKEKVERKAKLDESRQFGVLSQTEDQNRQDIQSPKIPLTCQQQLSQQQKQKEVTPKEELQEGEQTEKDQSKLPWSITIAGSSKSLPWYDPTSCTYASLSSAHEANVYTYPPEPLYEQSMSKIKVFEDLWRKGYYMGSGLKFGGDFLVYPGNLKHSLRPLR